jgi:hypothetical protein
MAASVVHETRLVLHRRHRQFEHSRLCLSLDKYGVTLLRTSQTLPNLPLIGVPAEADIEHLTLVVSLYRFLNQSGSPLNRQRAAVAALLNCYLMSRNLTHFLRAIIICKLLSLLFSQAEALW